MAHSLTVQTESTYMPQFPCAITRCEDGTILISIIGDPAFRLEFILDPYESFGDSGYHLVGTGIGQFPIGQITGAKDLYAALDLLLPKEDPA